MCKIPNLGPLDGGWVAVDRKTGLGVFETSVKKTANSVCQARYDVLTISDYLGRLNFNISKHGGEMPPFGIYSAKQIDLFGTGELCSESFSYFRHLVEIEFMNLSEAFHKAAKLYRLDPEQFSRVRYETKKYFGEFEIENLGKLLLRCDELSGAGILDPILKGFPVKLPEETR